MNRWLQSVLSNHNRLPTSIVYIMLVFHAGMIAWSAAHQSPTIDEPVHLSAGLWNWTKGSRELNRGNPPLIDLVASAPLLLAKPAVDWKRLDNSFLVAGDFYEANGERSYLLTMIGRWALIPFSLLGGYVCWRWAKELYGLPAGLLAVTLWCFCPYIIANAEIVTGDMGSTALILTTCYLFRNWLLRPNWTKALQVGFMWGMAEISKFVAIVLYPTLPAIWLFSLLIRWHGRERFDLKREGAQILVMFILSIYVINLAYEFHGTGASVKEFKFLDHLIPRSENTTGGIRGLLKDLPIPLPRNYLRGIDEISTVSNVEPRMYFAGDWNEGGLWYYYLCGMGMKLPIGTLVLILLSPALTILKEYRVKLVDELGVLIPFATLFIFINISTSIQYFRYLLPVMPYVCIWASKAALAFQARHTLVAVIVILSTISAITATAKIYPHCGSYFNELVGGPENGHRYMLESSIDWGQDALYLKSWQMEHLEAGPLHLAYFGHCDPRLAGVNFRIVPTWKQLTMDRGESLLPGWYAVSVSLLRGFGWPVVPDGKGGSINVLPSDYEYLLEFEPDVRIGYSINLYHLDSRDIDVILTNLSTAH